MESWRLWRESKGMSTTLHHSIFINFSNITHKITLCQTLIAGTCLQKLQRIHYNNGDDAVKMVVQVNGLFLLIELW